MDERIISHLIDPQKGLEEQSRVGVVSTAEKILSSAYGDYISPFVPPIGGNIRYCSRKETGDFLRKYGESDEEIIEESLRKSPAFCDYIESREIFVNWENLHMRIPLLFLKEMFHEGIHASNYRGRQGENDGLVVFNSGLRRLFVEGGVLVREEQSVLDEAVTYYLTICGLEPVFFGGEAVFENYYSGIRSSYRQKAKEGRALENEDAYVFIADELIGPMANIVSPRLICQAYFQGKKRELMATLDRHFGENGAETFFNAIETTDIKQAWLMLEKAQT